MATARRAPTVPARAASRGGARGASRTGRAALAALTAAGRLVEVEASVAGPPGAAARPAADFSVAVVVRVACPQVAVVWKEEKTEEVRVDSVDNEQFSRGSVFVCLSRQITIHALRSKS